MLSLRGSSSRKLLKLSDVIIGHRLYKDLYSISLLQINRRMEFVFASHSFDVWESWTLEGSLKECRLVNCRNPLVSSSLAPFNSLLFCMGSVASGHLTFISVCK